MPADQRRPPSVELIVGLITEFYRVLPSFTESSASPVTPTESKNEPNALMPHVELMVGNLICIL